MRCARCRGLMVDEFLVDRANEGLEGPGVWRCVNCGDLVDLGVLHNRMSNLTQLLQCDDLKQRQVRRSARSNTGDDVKERRVPTLHKFRATVSS